MFLAVLTLSVSAEELNLCEDTNWGCGGGSCKTNLQSISGDSVTFIEGYAADLDNGWDSITIDIPSEELFVGNSLVINANSIDYEHSLSVYYDHDQDEAVLCEWQPFNEEIGTCQIPTSGAEIRIDLDQYIDGRSLYKFVLMPNPAGSELQINSIKTEYECAPEPDLASDPNNCGGCGIICLANYICQMAICQIPPDLSIEYVKPIQVIENPDSNKNQKIDFVESKPAMARVKVKLDNADSIDEVEIKLEIFELNPRKKVWEETITKEIKSSYTLKEIKDGEDSVNFFPSKPGTNTWLPVKEKEYIFKATVDPNNAITEGDETNNEGSSAKVETGENKQKIKVFAYSVKVTSTSGTSYSTGQEYTLQLVRKNMEFLKKVYPYNPRNVKDILDGDYDHWVFNYKNPLSTPKERREMRRFIAKQIRKGISRLNLHKVYPNHILIPVVVVPHEIMDGAQAYNYNGLVMISNAPAANDAAILSHEFGHRLGLYKGGGKNEQYEKFPPFGLLASPGWELIQSNGLSNGRKVNVHPDPPPANGVVANTELDPATLDPLGPRYYDIMGNVPENNVWIHKTTYEHLLKMLVKFK